jgi:hypothetical protein
MVTCCNLVRAWVCVVCVHLSVECNGLISRVTKSIANLNAIHAELIFICKNLRNIFVKAEECHRPIHISFRASFRTHNTDVELFQKIYVGADYRTFPATTKLLSVCQICLRTCF